MNGHFTLNAGLRVGVKYLVRVSCYLLKNLLMSGSRGLSVPDASFNTVKTYVRFVKFPTDSSIPDCEANTCFYELYVCPPIFTHSVYCYHYAGGE